MKATNHFTRTILTYLEQRAETDVLFAQAFAREDKNIDTCVTYILNTVQKSGCHGFADDEVYSIAMDYYKSDSIEAGKPINAKIMVNHIVELTAEEKEEARKEALQRAEKEAYNKMMTVKKRPTSNKQPQCTNQLSLF